MNADFIMAVQELGKEKGIEPSILFEAVEEALVTAYKKNFGSNQNVRVDLNRTSGELHVYAQKHVVETAEDSANEITLEDARKIDPRYELDDIVEIEVTPKNLAVLPHRMQNRLLFSVSAKRSAAWCLKNIITAKTTLLPALFSVWKTEMFTLIWAKQKLF